MALMNSRTMRALRSVKHGRRPKAKAPYRRFPSMRAKKGRTGGKRRAGVSRKFVAPVAVGTGMVTGRRGPAGIGYSMRQVSDTCTRITGRAYVGEVNTTGKLTSLAGTKSNCLGLVFDLNPSLLNDRVAVIASTFQKYVYQGVKFTYVPQCSTSTPGSIGLVFDRDPLEISANTQGDQFLAEVMSYEHAVLTPAYVEASTAYSRDPKELKTWYLGAPDATLTTRETSQGNLLVYLSNAQMPNATTGFNGGYGFIVMDYVLDLIAPSLLPAKQNITAINRAPSQWIDCNAVSTNFPSQSTAPATVFPSGANGYDMWDQPGWLSNFDAAAIKPGVVGEIHLGGFSAAKGNFQITLNPASKVVFADSTTITSSTFKYGQKMYFCLHSTVPLTGNVHGLSVSWHTTLASARAAASETRGAIGRPEVLQDAIYGLEGTGGLVPSISVGGWARLISEGQASEDNA